MNERKDDSAAYENPDLFKAQIVNYFVNQYTLGVMSPMVLHHRYMAELVWLPTHISLAILILGTVANSALATVLTLVSLIAARMILEFVYRVALGDARLQLRTQVAAFSFQTVVWGFVWFLYAQRTAAA